MPKGDDIYIINWKIVFKVSCHLQWKTYDCQKGTSCGAFGSKKRGGTFPINIVYWLD